MSNPKKVVILGSAHPLRGGLATYNERLAREFQNQGSEVKIYTFTIQYPSIFFPGKSQYTSSPAPEDLSIERAVNSVNPLNWIRVGRKIRKEKPDLLIFKFWIPFMAPCFGKIARMVKKNGHTKIAAIIDNIIPHEKRPGDKMLSNYFVKSVDGFVAMSDSVLHDLEKFDQKKKKIFCPHPLYDNFGAAIPKKEAIGKLGLDPEYNYMLFFGFIRGYKGLDLMLSAFAESLKTNDRLRLIVAGEFYTDSKPYFNQIEELGIKDKVVMSNDFIPDEKVVEYFCAADIIVQPYKDATQSGVTQIAYHFNKPMIVTNVGGLAEIVPNDRVGYVVKPEVSEIAEAINKFYSLGKEEYFTANTIVEKEKYAWHRMTESVLLCISN